MSPHRNQRIWIRFKNLTPDTVSDLSKTFAKSKLGTNERRVTNKDKIVALLYLDESIDCNKLSQFIAKHKIRKRNYILWISLVTEQYSDGVLVPTYALNVLCRLNCRLNVSFTKI